MQSTYIYLGAINENNIEALHFDRPQQARHPNKHLWIYEKYYNQTKKKLVLDRIQNQILFKFNIKMRKRIIDEFAG